MCKLEGIKWIVIKSQSKLSKSLKNKLSKVGFSPVGTEYSVSDWYTSKEKREKVLKILKSYKRIKFEICEFYDKQKGLSFNTWNGEMPIKLPLSHRFVYGDSQITTTTPITKKQFDNIIKIN